MNNSIEDIFIGVDGGASKCRVRVEDAHGNCLGQNSAGHASLKVSVDDAWHTIMNTLRIALRDTSIMLDDITAAAAAKLPVKYRLHIGCGLTGTELPKPYAEFLAKTPACFATSSLNSDAYTACLGAHGGKDGAIIVVGTGVVGIQIQNGKTSKVGAWGFPHGDEGSAAWVGMEAVRLTTQWFDGRAEFKDSALPAAIFNKFDNDQTKLIVWANGANSTEFAKITPLVIEYLQKDDPVAITLIQQAAQEIDKVGVALAKRSEGQQLLPCALLGGLAQFVAPWLSAELRARVVSPQGDAMAGAILMIKY